MTDYLLIFDFCFHRASKRFPPSDPLLSILCPPLLAVEFAFYSMKIHLLSRTLFGSTCFLTPILISYFGSSLIQSSLSLFISFFHFFIYYSSFAASSAYFVKLSNYIITPNGFAKKINSEPLSQRTFPSFFSPTDDFLFVCLFVCFVRYNQS